MRAAHLWQMLLNALFTSHLVCLIIGGRGKGHYFSLSLRGAQRRLSSSPRSPPPPCHAPKKIPGQFLGETPLQPSSPAAPRPREALPRAAEQRCPLPQTPRFPGSSPSSRRLYPGSSKCCRVMVPQRGRARLPRPRCSRDAPSPLSGRESPGSAARHKPAYSPRASAQMKFQRGARLGPPHLPRQSPCRLQIGDTPSSNPTNTKQACPRGQLRLLGQDRLFPGAHRSLPDGGAGSASQSRCLSGRPVIALPQTLWVWTSCCLPAALSLPPQPHRAPPLPAVPRVGGTVSGRCSFGFARRLSDLGIT